MCCKNHLSFLYTFFSYIELQKNCVTVLPPKLVIGGVWRCFAISQAKTAKKSSNTKGNTVTHNFFVIVYKWRHDAKKKHFYDQNLVTQYVTENSEERK